jgi:hypothetical protein
LAGKRLKNLWNFDSRYQLTAINFFRCLWSNQAFFLNAIYGFMPQHNWRAKMDQTERQVIDDLFARLRQAEQGSGPRDAGAESHIRQMIAQHPAAPYYMAQAIIVQEHALKGAQERIEELENTAAQPAQSGGFLGGLFGGGAQAGRGSVPRSGGGMTYPRNGAGTAAQSPVAQYQQSGRGGGFLAGAMQTAMGVAGGVLVANMISNMLGGDEAKAEEPAAAEQQTAQDQGSEAQNANDDDGNFFGHDGDFDV